MKKIISIAVVLIMVLSLVACQFSADNRVNEGVYKSQTMKLQISLPDGWTCSELENLGERNSIMFFLEDDENETPDRYIFAYMDTCYDFKADHSYMVAEAMQSLNSGKKSGNLEFEILQSSPEEVREKEGFVFRAKSYDKVLNVTSYLSQYYIYDEENHTMYMFEFHEQGEGEEYTQQMHEIYMNTLNSFKTV